MKLLFFKKGASGPIALSLILAGIFCSVFYVFAVPPASVYGPGDTLDPNCAPGSTNCTVTSPAVYSFSSNNFSGTGDFTTTGTITAGTLKVGSVYTFPAADGTGGYVLSTDGAGVLSWISNAAMTYPGAGIAVSTGSAWTTSLTDNSSNWNAAYTHKTTEDAISGLVFVDGAGNYSAKTIGTDIQAYHDNLASLAGLTYASTSFVTMTAAGTFALDTNTYLTSLSGAVLADGSVTGATASAQTFTNGVNLSNLTSGRVPYATTDGLLTDSANLTFDGTTLTAAAINTNATGTGITMSGASGVLTVGGVGNTNNENLTFDFETTSNKVAIASGTGVTDITTALALTVGNLTDSGLTATRVTYAGASGLLSDSADFTFASGNLTLGAASTSTGKLSIKGTTSGTVDITTGAEAGTWTLTLPSSAGSSGQLVNTNGTTWGYTTATYPSTAASTGTILRADGTNWVATTATYPTTTTANQLLYSSATNTIAGLATGNSSVLVTDGSGVPSLSTTLPASIVLSNTTYVGAATGVGLSATNGVLTLAGAKTAGYNENLTFDFETTENKVAIASGTSVSDITTTLALTVGNLTDSGLTATRVTYAGASGLLSDSADFTFASGNLTLGAASTSTGKLSIKGTTSGTVDITTGAAAGTWTLTLPANDGDTGQFLQTNGSGITTWAAALTNPMTTIGDIIYASETATPATPARLAGGSTGQILQSNTGAAPSWSTATYPSVATGTGTILRADGTNWVATTATYPTTTTANQILYSTATNTVGGDSGLTFDGTTLTVGSSTEVFTVLDTGYVGISATSPSYHLSFGGDAARTIGLERNTTTNGSNLTISAGGALSGGTNLNAGALYLKAGVSTGSGGSSDIFFQTATPGASGTDDVTPTTKLTIRNNGNVVVGTAALAASATSGFLYLPSYGGDSSGIGTPTTETGTVPVWIDTTNGRIYAYYNSAWKYAAITTSFQIPNHETVDPLSGEQIKEGDFVLGMIDKTMTDNALHGIWVKWETVKAQLLAEAKGQLAADVGTWSGGSVDSISGTTFIEKVKNALYSLGIEIKDGAVSIASLSAKKFTADRANIKLANIETMQMVDQKTGEIYCTWIANGQWKKSKGECSTMDFSNSPATEVSTITEIQSQAQPQSGTQSSAQQQQTTSPAEVNSASQTTDSSNSSETSTTPKESSQQTSELTKQQQHAIEQAADQAAREASQQTASKVTEQVKEKIKEEVQSQLKEQNKEEKSSKSQESPAETSETPSESPAETETPAESEPEPEAVQETAAPEVNTESEQQPAEPSASEESTVEVNTETLGDLVQEAAAGLLIRMWEFVSWITKLTISSVPKIIPQNITEAPAGLFEAIKNNFKYFTGSVKNSLENKTPDIIEKTTASVEQAFSNIFYYGVQSVENATSFAGKMMNK